MEPRAVVPLGEERTMDVAKTMRATKATSLRALASEATLWGQRVDVDELSEAVGHVDR